MEVCGILARDAVNPFPPPSRSIIHEESFRIGQGRQQELVASLPEGLTWFGREQGKTPYVGTFFKTKGSHQTVKAHISDGLSWEGATNKRAKRLEIYEVIQAVW